MIPYCNPDDPLTAAKWNLIFDAADAFMDNALSGLSGLFAPVGADGGGGGLQFFVEGQWNRMFFFFDPVNLPANLHPAATYFFKDVWNRLSSFQRVMYMRQYDDTAIASQVAGLSQLANTSAWQVVKLSLPTWSAWNAAVYPSGFNGLSTSGLTQTISSVVYPSYNCLDVSLKVIKMAVGGTPYNVTFLDLTTAEHVQPLKPVDVFIVGGFSWDAAWDKYNIVRVHNCSTAAATATFGTVSASLPAGGSRCFRRVAGLWKVCGKYFHTMESGDGRFIQMREYRLELFNGIDVPSCNVFHPGVVADRIANVLLNAKTNFGKYFDISKMMDLSPVYNSASYVPTAHEKTPPTGGYLAALNNSALLGDLLIHRGKMLVANRATPSVVHATQRIVAAGGVNYNFTDGTNTVAGVSNMAVYDVTTGQSIPIEGTPGNPLTANWAVNYTTQQFTIIPQAGYITAGDVLNVTFDYLPPDNHVMFDFEGFGTLAAKLASVGVGTRALSESISGYVAGGTVSNLEIYTSNWHLIDLSCPLVTFITGGTSPLPAKVMGSSQGSSPPSLKLPWMQFQCVAVVPNPSTAGYTYNNWGTDGSGNPVITTSVSVSVTTDSSTQSLKQNIFLPTDAVSSVQSWLSATAGAGGIITAGNFGIYSTTFGPVLTWEEIWPLTARFVSLYEYSVIGDAKNAVFTSKVVYEELVGLRVTRAMFLNETRVWTVSGTGNVFPWEFGIFPPRERAFRPYGGNESGSNRFMFWNFARTDRRYVNYRWFYHDPADSAWMPAIGGTHYASDRFITSSGFWSLMFQDELQKGEFMPVKSFYEYQPLGADAVLPASGFRKTGISRMGAWSLAADIWTPFANWLNGSGNITYNNDGVNLATISISSSWYGTNSASVLANATIGDKLPNAQPCQAEHYNTLASLINAQPPMRYDVGNLATQLYSIASLPLIPTYNALTGGGVDGTGKVPRNAFYFWSYTPGTDPIGDYFRGLVLGAGFMPVSTTLPDGYVSTNYYEWITIDDARTLYAQLGIPFVLDATAVPLSWRTFTAGAYSQSDWFNDAHGSWLLPHDGRRLCSDSSPLFEDSRSWGGPNGTNPPEFPVVGTYTTTFPFTATTYYYYPPKISWNWRWLVVLAEGIADQVVACIPENVVYYDMAWLVPNFSPWRQLGNSIIPKIADNGIEGDLTESSLIRGDGHDVLGNANPEHIITTGLLNARLVKVSIDQYIAAAPEPPGGGI